MEVCFSIFFSYFAGMSALLVFLVLLVLALLTVIVLRKLKRGKGNCLIIIHEICFLELGKAWARSMPASCVALPGTCSSSSSFSM